MNCKKLGRNIESLLFLGFTQEESSIMLEIIQDINNTKLLNQHKIDFENNTVYGMHDAPGGKQNMFVFKKLNGKDLKENDIKYIQLPWSCLSPNVKEDFNKEFQNRNGSYKKSEIQKYKDFLTKKNLKTENELGTNVNYLLSSKRSLSQSYTGISLETGDYIYIRGKKGKLNEAWVFKVLEDRLKFEKKDGNWITQKKMMAIKKVPNEIYEKIKGQRGSIWNMNPDEKKLLNI